MIAPAAVKFNTENYIFGTTYRSTMALKGYPPTTEDLALLYRLSEMSGVNIRDVYADDLPYRPEMIVSDVSFISLTYVIPVIARIAAPQAQIVLLVKPQFEVGKGNLGKNGIVESRELRERALTSVVACAERNGLDVRATTVSPIEGTHGNIEYLLYAVMQ